ncbi:MAG: transcription termination factor Rho [Planctomycetes bacterium]|nr:transcription termination factor Rho [Planctomycetota bacterium]
MHHMPGRRIEGLVEFMEREERSRPNHAGFLRVERKNYRARFDDPFLPPHVARDFGLRPSSWVEAEVVPTKNKPFPTVRRIFLVDGEPPERAARRARFHTLTSMDPIEKFTIENGQGDVTLRVIDLLTPIGKGQRGIIVAAPRTGKTVILQKVAKALEANHPEVHVMVLLVDERPEEVTEWRRETRAEVVASSSDEMSYDHVRVAEIVGERAKRLVEMGRDVVILLDSLTRLGRAYNLETTNSGRTLSGGVDARTLEKPKNLFGAARKIDGRGSLTVLATALIDTGSRMDQVIFEEFKGTGNMEIVLSRKLADLRIFPAIDMQLSGTRKEEKLIPPEQLRQIWALRRVAQSMDPIKGMRILIEKLAATTSNAQFLNSFATRV